MLNRYICFNQSRPMQEILNNLQIEQKVNRLAHQLLENIYGLEKVFIVGIEGNGSVLANELAAIVKKHNTVDISVANLKINKEEPWSDAIKLDIDIDTLKNGYIILVDDVINSGKTMQYALTEFLKFPTTAIKTVVLVDRKHRRFPIKADYVGLSLSTTLKERVEVELDKERRACLM